MKFRDEGPTSAYPALKNKFRDNLVKRKLSFVENDNNNYYGFYGRLAVYITDAIIKQEGTENG